MGTLFLTNVFACLGAPAIAQGAAEPHRFRAQLAEGHSLFRRGNFGMVASAMFSPWAKARHFAVFLVALIGLYQPATAASVIQFEMKEWWGDDQYSDPFLFSAFFEEDQVYYDGTSGAQIARIYAAYTPKLDDDFPFEERPFETNGYISLSPQDGRGFWPIFVSVFWDRDPANDNYWMQGGAGLYTNDQSPPNFLVEGSWLAEPLDLGHHNDLLLLHAFAHSNTDYRPDYYLVLNNITISSVPQIPEPSTWALLLLGFGAIGLAIRRHRPRPAVG